MARWRSQHPLNRIIVVSMMEAFGRSMDARFGRSVEGRKGKCISRVNICFSKNKVLPPSLMEGVQCNQSVPR